MKSAATNFCNNVLVSPSTPVVDTGRSRRSSPKGRLALHQSCRGVGHEKHRALSLLMLFVALVAGIFKGSFCAQFRLGDVITPKREGLVFEVA